jgi:osmotically-inducible protein OsmY
VRARLLTTFSLNEYLHAFDIGVGVTDDTVTLTGTVDSPAARDLAGRLARDLSGIAAVDNQLRVVPGLEPAPRLNPYYRMVQQANLATRVRLQLIWRDSIGGLLVDVTTRGDTVILAGKVRSQAAKERAGRIALRTAGVAAVDNQLEVDPDAEVAETVGPAMASAGATVPDGWISARVKGALRFDRTVDADRIDVSAENGVVTLSGQVPSAGQKRAAAAIAAEIEGVQSVDNALSVDEAA